MNSRNSPAVRTFVGTLEQCVEQYGGKTKFTVYGPVTFFSGARLETYRRAQSNDGTVVITEHQLRPTSCEVYVRPAAIAPERVRLASVAQSNCA
ncbi:MAG TPA: hypothetical protein VJQ59_12740 [Candidatus Sulfotelmatobacter sp.]|nr:hypothetical protein [Candidatus Sulfotelmatobacter sp.]